MRILSEFLFGDTAVRYFFDPAGHVGLLLFPTACAPLLVPKRTTLRGEPEIDALPGSPALAATAIHPLIHVKFAGEPYSGAFAQGRSMLCAPTNDRFTYRQQQIAEGPASKIIITKLADNNGVELHHWLVDLNVRVGTGTASVFQITSRIINNSPHPITLELLTSFSLSGITPFHPADAPGRLRVHRFRASWSAEGRLDTQSIEQLNLERSWSGASLVSERFGQVGTLPVRGWFPWAVTEDTVAGVCWGAQLAWAGSWQMEIARQHDDVSLNGGLADREFGHWTKTLAPGESFTSPPAIVACVRGTLDDLCDRLTSVQHATLDAGPEVEQDLPLVFNEWCSTWGHPSQQRLERLTQRLQGSGVRYFVIDAGWYKPDVRRSWDGTHGDWIPNPELFPPPGGLKAAADAIHAAGMVPGLWFELETVGHASAAFARTDWLLQRDGTPITVRGRRFLDLNHPEVIDYLTTRVIDTLEQCGFGYLKIDYNETLGVGCDPTPWHRRPADVSTAHSSNASPRSYSLGEGLRQQIDATYRFFDRIRQRLPNLVIENCASGGHRHELSMLAHTQMSSFSDAHELREIPIIAAHLQRLLLPRQCQVWAVLHASDSEQRLVYSLAAGFLGRLCLSGDIDQLSPAQWVLVQRALALYQRCAPIIKHGTSHHYGQLGPSWRHPTGWQAVVRTYQDEALLVAHNFENAPHRCVVALPNGMWDIIEQLGEGLMVEEGGLNWKAQDFSGMAVYLRKKT